MIKTLKESQLNNRVWVPYGRLISEILHQGGILKALDETKVFTHQQLDTVTGKIINGSTLGHDLDQERRHHETGHRYEIVHSHVQSHGRLSSYLQARST